MKKDSFKYQIQQITKQFEEELSTTKSEKRRQDLKEQIHKNEVWLKTGVYL